MMKLLPDLMLRKEFDGTGMLFNPKDGKSFYLNHTSAFICSMLEDGASREEIAAGLKEHAENLSENFEQELEKFLNSLRAEGFICD